MTLDDFKNRMDGIAAELQQKMTALLEEGVQSKLDEELMLAIVNQSMAKIGELG